MNVMPLAATNKEQEQQADRYVTFCGIDCYLNSDRLMTMLENNINAGNGDKRWHTYFAQKREQQAKLQHDNLNFIGHQTNTLYEYFELCNDQAALALLYKIEQECC
ncbi:N(2)-fixation sustaining protein CowN [Psychromonas sp.]|uniref:N(2)-fixation sustaining protein CowN n=1 Tax=Psychromonas sp. TaxID=1884585 RepID=UPI003566D90C